MACQRSNFIRENQIFRPMNSLLRISLSLAVSLILLSCEKDENGYSDCPGDRIYTAAGPKTISTIHWISDAELVVVEHELVEDPIYNWIYTINIIDIQSNSISDNDLDKGEGDIYYSIMSDNHRFIYCYFVDNQQDLRRVFRLDLVSGEKLLLSDKALQFTIQPFCVSPDDSRIAYQISDSICIYDVANNKEIRLMEGIPVLFTDDNKELLYASTSSWSLMPLYSYNLESGNSQLVFSGGNIHFENSVFRPTHVINAIKEEDDIFLTIHGDEDNYLIYNLKEASPVFSGKMMPFNVWSDDNLICGDGMSLDHGCNYAFDSRNMKLYSWAFVCVDKIWEGWSYTCSPYRYNLTCIETYSRAKTIPGYVLNKYVGVTKISPDGTKLAYISGNNDPIHNYRFVCVYNISD